MKKLIEEDLKERHTLDEDEQEMVHQASFVRKRTESFMGREALLRTTMANIAATNAKITVIHGISGAGDFSVPFN